MSAPKTEHQPERTTVSVYTSAHGKALDAVHALRKQKPPVKISITAFSSDAISAAADAVLTPRKLRKA